MNKFIEVTSVYGKIKESINSDLIKKILPYEKDGYGKLVDGSKIVFTDGTECEYTIKYNILVNFLNQKESK